MIIVKQGIRVFNFSMATNSVDLSKNYYKILQVDHSCDQKVIKKSYLQLVKKLHPDVNPNGKDKFTEVQQAYEVLSDNDLKKYYDQNNYLKRGSPDMNQAKGSSSYSYSTQAGSSQSGQTRKASSGHEYYTHRNYSSENPRDYFYNDNEAKYQHKTQKKNNTFTQDQHSQGEPFYRNPYTNKQQKYANSKKSWQFYQQQKKYKQQQTYRQQTAQQRRLRDKIKAMRGFTSQYNVMWARHHLKPDILMTGDKRNEKEELLKSIMPEKVRKFYDMMMDKLEEISMKGK